MQFERSTVAKLAVGIGVGAVSAYGIYSFLKSKATFREQDWVEVGTISEICVYPIKSCKPQFVQEVKCLPLGSFTGEYFDRQFALSDAEGKHVLGKNVPKMLLVESKLSNGILTLFAPGKEPIDVDLAKVIENGRVNRVETWFGSSIDAYDCGDDGASWLNTFLVKDNGVTPSYRLVYYTPGLFNGKALNVYKNYYGIPAFRKRKDITMFADITSYMLMTEESMEDLNSRVPSGEKFSTWNFRPNFVVTGTKEPFDEDKWANVRIGKDAIFTNVKACTRCILTAVNWTTGERHPKLEPLRTLRGYHTASHPEEVKCYGKDPIMGICMALDHIGTVHVGDPVYAIYKKGGFS